MNHKKTRVSFKKVRRLKQAKQREVAKHRKQVRRKHVEHVLKADRNQGKADRRAANRKTVTPSIVQQIFGVR